MIWRNVSIRTHTKPSASELLAHALIDAEALHAEKEAEHQAALVRWLRARNATNAAASVLFTAPSNGSHCTRSGAVKAARLGMQRGAPDLLIFDARHGFTGLAVELKRPRPRHSRLSDAQIAYISALRVRGWCAEVCYGAGEAYELIAWYLDAPELGTD